VERHSRILEQVKDRISGLKEIIEIKEKKPRRILSQTIQVL
jgi:hypothetical protein